ncbi:hypothetical protein PAMP_018840 [Pampus punctatissimus]
MEWHSIAVSLNHRVLLGYWSSRAYRPIPLLSYPQTDPESVRIALGIRRGIPGLILSQGCRLLPLKFPPLQMKVAVEVEDGMQVFQLLNSSKLFDLLSSNCKSQNFSSMYFALFLCAMLITGLCGICVVGCFSRLHCLDVRGRHAQRGITKGKFRKGSPSSNSPSCSPTS